MIAAIKNTMNTSILLTSHTPPALPCLTCPSHLPSSPMSRISLTSLSHRACSQVRLLDKSTASANSFGKGSSMKFDILISTPLRLVRDKPPMLLSGVAAAVDAAVQL